MVNWLRKNWSVKLSIYLGLLYTLRLTANWFYILILVYTKGEILFILKAKGKEVEQRTYNSGDQEADVKRMNDTSMYISDFSYSCREPIDVQFCLLHITETVGIRRKTLGFVSQRSLQYFCPFLGQGNFGGRSYNVTSLV